MWELRKAIKRHYGTVEAFSRKIGRSSTYVYNRLNRKKPLADKEVKSWIRILGGLDIDALPKE